jgi:methylated-DNA-[protein]-cysteine S-methyltransferase
MTARENAQRALREPKSNIATWCRTQTRFGDFHVAALDGAIVQTALPGTSTPAFLSQLQERFPHVHFREAPDDGLLQRAAQQLQEYGEGRRQDFDLPVRLEGTAFQARVWKALADIPYGTTRSYQDIARAIGRPGASRAVGQANHMNPLAPIVPCHRVVNSSGGLGGYGGGTHLKKALLSHEGVPLE